MIQRENNGTSMHNSLLRNGPLSVCASLCILFVEFFLQNSFYQYTLPMLHFFFVVLFSCFAISVSFLVLHSFHVEIFCSAFFQCWTFFMKHCFHVPFFLYHTLFILFLSLFMFSSCFTFSMFHFFELFFLHVVFFSYCYFSV